VRRKEEEGEVKKGFEKTHRNLQHRRHRLMITQHDLREATILFALDRLLVHREEKDAVCPGRDALFLTGGDENSQRRRVGRERKKSIRGVVALCADVELEGWWEVERRFFEVGEGESVLLLDLELRETFRKEHEKGEYEE
jgi:hypothetical protein